jgi:hypothetical protein
MANVERPWKSSGLAYRRRGRIESCDTCHNLKLDGKENVDVRVKIDYFELAESSELDDCIYCSLIFHALSEAEASVKYDGYSVVAIHAQSGKPFFVSWDDSNRGPQYLEISHKATCRPHTQDI